MNKSWDYKKIGDVCIVERGGSPRPIDKFITDAEDGVNWIKIGDTSDSMYITETAQKIILEGVKKSRYVKPGDFLLSNSMSFGRPYILKIDGCIHDGWLVLRDEQELFDKRFLYYYLSSKATYEKFKSMAVGGVVNNLNSEMVRKVEVPVPSKEEQSEIADFLDRLKRVLNRRKEELLLLDDLIKARFVEMIQYAELTEETTIKHIAECVKVGFVGTCEKYYTDSTGVPMLRTGNITSKGIALKDLKFVTTEFHEKNKKSQIHTGDLLIARHGSNGQANVYEGPEAQCLNAVIIVPDLRKTKPIFLAGLINSSFVKEQINRTLVGSTQHVINTKSIADLKVRVPSLEIQIQYEQFVQQVNKSKASVQKALDETQLLFDSLMQKYFG